MLNSVAFAFRVTWPANFLSRPSLDVPGMSFCVNQCLKRFPLVHFRYASTAASRVNNPAAPDLTADAAESPKPKKRSSRKPKTLPELKVPAKNKLKEHLEKLAETNGKLVLADIERCRPPSHPAPGSVIYEEEYNNLFKKISDSFTTKQLHQFAKLYGMSWASRRPVKQDYVHAILEGWNWPSLTTIREKQKETEPAVES